MSWNVEASSLGRIVAPENLPEGVGVLCTSSDFEGRLTESGVAAIRSLLRERFDFKGSLSSCAQVHGGSVTSVDAKGHWTEAAGCDAMVSIESGMALVVKVADCLPLSLVDVSTLKIANVHSGWRGAAARIVPAALSALENATEPQPALLRAWIGPSIRVCCFEVGEEVVEQLETAYGYIDQFVDRSKEKPHVDLAGLTTHTLIEAGLPPEAIDDSELCTRCDGSIFHSFRRDGEASGRNLMVVVRN